MALVFEIATFAVLAVFFVVDLFIIGRKPHVPSTKECVQHIAFFVVMALIFGGLMWFFAGLKPAIEFYSGWLTEYSLSIDNLFVFVIIMSNFAVPKQLQKFVLSIGITIALVLRGVFILIGGWFLCEQQYKTRRPLSLWLSLWLYTVPVTLLCKLAGLDVSWGALRWAAFPASTRQLWFISDYLLLLLCVPLLNRLLRGLSRPAHRGLLAVLAVPLIVYPTLFGENGAVSDTAWMFLYEYLLITYLRRWPDNRLAHLLQHRAAALGLGLGLPLLNTILRAVLETRGLTDGKAFQYMAYYRTALGALPNLLAALALFYLFKGLDLGCVRWVNALAGTTLGVYILHQVPAFRGFLWNGLLQAEAHHGSVGYTLLAILAVFLGCAAVDALRTALVMRPLENTRLFKALCEKGDALAAKITADD